MRSVALVIPWFGKELTGGAEQQAWQVATRLAARGYQLTVLTTCCRAFQELLPCLPGRLGNQSSN